MARFTTTGGGGEGTPGAPGADGADGADGQDALWNYTGEYSGGAAYAVGDIATYDGQLWYRYNSNGGNVGDTPSPGLWNLLAAKGVDGADASGGLVYLGNYISGNGYIANIAVVRGTDNNLYIAKSSGGLGDPVDNTEEWEIFSENSAGADTGSVTFMGVYVIGAGGESGDGLGNGTLKLMPDADLNSDQYLILDPTGPNHIHVRAGGAIDESTAELIFGGERNKVTVSDNERLVLISTRPPGEEPYENQWIFGSDGILIGPGEDNLLKVNGLYGKDTDPLLLVSPDAVVIIGDGGEFLNDSTVADNQIATIGDLPTGATGTFESADSKLITVTNGIITSIAPLT